MAESVYCPCCQGSGEGRYDGSRCPYCHGTGEVMVDEDGQTVEELEDDDDPE